MWWEEFFDDSYIRYANSRANYEMEKVAQFLVEVLKLEPGTNVYDQCCGIGDISLVLAQKGIKCVGVDQSESYITQAIKRALKGDLDCEFKKGNAFDYISKKPCDAVINWHTSFGYDIYDIENLEMLKRAYESLKNGGRFVLDYYNKELLSSNFQEELSFDVKVGESIVKMKKESKLENGMLKSWWKYEDGKEYYGESRYYSPEELITMIRSVGFQIVDIFGSVEGDRFGEESGRCIVVSEK